VCETVFRVDLEDQTSLKCGGGQSPGHSSSFCRCESGCGTPPRDIGRWRRCVGEEGLSSRPHTFCHAVSTMISCTSALVRMTPPSSSKSRAKSFHETVHPAAGKPNARLALQYGIMNVHARRPKGRPPDEQRMEREGKTVSFVLEVPACEIVYGRNPPRHKGSRANRKKRLQVMNGLAPRPSVITAS